MQRRELFEMPEFGKGLLTLELELEETELDKPGRVKYAGRLLIPSDLPTPLPAFSRVVAEREGEEPIVSDDVILPIGPPKVGVEWEWFKPPRPVARIPLGEYFGELNFEEVGEYKIHAEAYPTILRMLPTLAKTEPVSFLVGKPGIRFLLERPTVSPSTTVKPFTDITISCPVTSDCDKPYDITVKCIVYEGSILPGHGDKLVEYTSDITPIAPGETKTFDFARRTVAGTIDRRDVEVQVFIGESKVKSSEWDDVYYVTVEVVKEIAVQTLALS